MVSYHNPTMMMTTPIVLSRHEVSSTVRSVTNTAILSSPLSRTVADARLMSTGTNHSAAISSTTTTATTTATPALTTNTAETTQTKETTPVLATTLNIPNPPWSELRLVVYQHAIPFIGFGIMDNAILIVAGDAIDTWMGVRLGISTMCAAAIGNIISDVAGVLVGTVVEDVSLRWFRFPTPTLSTEQRQLPCVRLASQCGICVGLVIGCIIGMFPLLFMDPNKNIRLKHQAKLQELLQDVMEEAKSLVHAEQTTLFLRVTPPQPPPPSSSLSSSTTITRIIGNNNNIINNNNNNITTRQDHHQHKHSNRNNTTLLKPTGDGQFLYAQYHTAMNDRHHNHKNDKQLQHDSSYSSSSSSSSSFPSSSLSSSRLIPLGHGIVSRCALTGQALNLYHVQAEPDFEPSVDTFDDRHGGQSVNYKTNVKHMLCVPVLDDQGRTIAVLQAINKISDSNHTQDNYKTTTLPKTPTSSSAILPSSTLSSHHSLRLHDENDDSFRRHRQRYSITSQRVGEMPVARENPMTRGFSSNDVQILKALASHISVALQSLKNDEVNVVPMRDTIRILKEHGTGILEQNQQPLRTRPLFPTNDDDDHDRHNVRR